MNTAEKISLSLIIFDFEWRGYSYGVQPDVNHYHAAKALTIAGTDIYHPTQDDLTGAEIAFGGDMTRSLKRDNYLVLETEAQGYPDGLRTRDSSDFRVIVTLQVVLTA